MLSKKKNNLLNYLFGGLRDQLYNKFGQLFNHKLNF